MNRVVKGTPFASLLKPQVENLLASPGLFKDNGKGRRFFAQAPIPFKITEEALSLFGMTSVNPEPCFGNFIGNHFLDGAFVHEHTDPAPAGFHHVRCNVALRMPSEGGHPVLDGKTFEVEEGDIWVCFASLERHSSVPTKGGQRITVSLGALVEAGEAERVFRSLLNETSTDLTDGTR